jgi:two-component system sensor kinase FixL
LQAAALRDELAHLGRVTLVDALTGSLAHELGQPLTAVTANAQAALLFMAMQPAALSDVRASLIDIRSDIERASQIMHRMRTLLKKGATRYEPIDINSTVSEVVKVIQGNAAGREIAIDLELAADLPPVHGDRIHIQQVLLNLLMNAFDAVDDQETPNRHVTLRTAPSDHVAVVEVRDRGAGLSDAELALIFDPFYTTKSDGIGLGLSICRTIVGSAGGTLGATRNPDRGMTFAATFPFWQPTEWGSSDPLVAQRGQER